MYIPEHFNETDPERLTALIDSHPFGMLLSVFDGAPFVSHLPFLLERDQGTQGRLLGHMARANPQWQHFAASRDVLVVFQGPHAYVSPSWYDSPGVPTWNYAVVHAHGTVKLVEDIGLLDAMLNQLTHAHESRMPTHWQPNLSGERRDRLLGMIVGFEIELTEIQGKFKLSQNRSHKDQQHVIDALNQSDNQIEIAVAKLMSASGRPHTV